MIICRKCGTASENESKFCYRCGAKLDDPPSDQQPAQTNTAPQGDAQQPPVNAQPQGYAPQPQTAPPQGYAPRPPFDFSRIPVRYRCPNGHVFDAGEGLTVCQKCGAPLYGGGLIQIYRMGNFIGCAVGMGIYIDGVPYGHLANKQSIRISVPFGMHMVHVTHTTTRSCNDPVYSLTPQYPWVWCKARFVSGGFAISVDLADPGSMPAN